MIEPTLAKRAYDVRVMSVDVGGAMRDTDAIRSVQSVETPGYSGFEIDEVNHDAAVVFFRIGGGEVRREPYHITIRFDTEGSPEQMIEVSVNLEVEG